MGPTRFTVAMIARAIMSGQPIPIPQSQIKTAAGLLLGLDYISIPAYAVVSY
jgi:hypothetical protein